MLDLRAILPPGKRFRELWLPKNIVDSKLPSSIPGGHALTLSGARRATTANGVRFLPGVATSNIKFSDPYDAVNNWWASFRFKLTQNFATGAAADQYLIGKYDDATNYLVVWLENADGKLYMSHREGDGAETVSSAEVSWTAGTLYHVLVSCSITEGQRLIVDGGAAQTEAGNTTAISLLADMCVGARDDGTSTEGLGGVISKVVMGNDILTQTAVTGEEALLAKGIPPSDAVNLFTLDEGRGTTAYDRGSGADDGTLDSSCTWDFDAKKLVAISPDGINDYGSASGVKINGNISIVSVMRAKSTYSSNPNASTFYWLRVDASNDIEFHSWPGAAQAVYYVIGNGTAMSFLINFSPAIDDYLIFINTLTIAGAIESFLNGVSKGTGSGAGQISGANATVNISSTHTPACFDVSSNLLFGIVEGALSAAETLKLSIDINLRLGLGLSI